MTVFQGPHTRVFNALLVVSACALVGCASAPPSLYEWGQYESQIYASYNDPGKVSPEEQIQKLEADYQKARGKNKAVPPGFHAQLGYLYFQIGKADQALQSFETEKQLFPESSVYMNRAIAKLKK
jgi:hypothetical protein